MTLGQKQRHFVRLIGMLIDFAYKQGYELSFGDAYRSPEQAAANAEAGTGIVNSLHAERLAVDFNLFVDGVYQRDSRAHKPLGDYWKSLDPLACWGGDFKDELGRPRPDGNHYSLEHNGIK